METYMETLGCRAKEASRAAAKLTTVEKNRGLEFVAEELCLRKEESAVRKREGHGGCKRTGDVRSTSGQIKTDRSTGLRQWQKG